MTKKRSSRQIRAGVSAVEFAVCLPAIMLIVFASIEACNMIFLQQSLQTVAYETARFAVTPQSNSTSAVSRGEQVLADRLVASAAIALEPTDVSSATRGDNVVVIVSAPLSDNRLMPDFFFGDQQLQARVTMMKE